MLHRLALSSTPKIRITKRDQASIFILCLSVRLYPINVKTDEPNCMEPYITPGKVYGNHLKNFKIEKMPGK